MSYTVEEIGARAKERNPELGRFSDAEIGDRLVKRNPNLATLVAPKALEMSVEQPKSFGRKVADVFTGSTQKFAETLGAAAGVATGATKRIDEAKMAEAESRFNLAKQLRTAGPEQAARIKSQLGQGTDVQTATETIPALMKTNKQVVGEALGSGLEAMSGGILSSGKKIAAGAVAKPVVQTLGGAIKAGAKTGAIYGGIGGTSQGMQKDKSTLGILGSAATGAGIGAGIGGALGGITHGISRGIQKTGEAITKQQGKIQARQAEKAKLLQSGAPDSRVATVKLEQGKVVADQKARELVNQGVDEADVALIRAAGAKDKTKMAKMLDIRQSQLTNKRVTDRATDIVGDSFLNQAKHLESVNKQAAMKLNKVAMGLAGKRADPTKAVQGLADDLEKAGVSIRGGKLSFKNSDYEGVPTAQRALQNAWTRAMRIAKTGDALQMHRAKTFIDEVVEYGKAAEGLSGRSQNILKTFRRGIDGALDSRFPTYNQANTQYADTITELHKIAEAMGRRFKIGDSFADARAGVVMRRILSNTQSRSDILQLLESMQAVARKYGMKIDDDIITQAQFADILEKILGSEAPTSFLGQIERGVSGAQTVAGAGSDLARGNIVSGTMKAGKYAIDILKGANQENLIKALRAMLN